MKPSTQQLARILRSTSFKQPECREKGIAVREFVLRNANSIDQSDFKRLDSVDLGLLFHIIDEQYFSGSVGRACEQIACRPLAFRVSSRMTTSGGMTTMTSSGSRRQFEIAIGTTPLFQTFRDNQPTRVGGVLCHNRLEALQRIMEHEVIHLAEMLVWGDSNCSARRFKGFATSFFGHSESNHQLLTPRDVARRKYNIRTGDKVQFRLNGKVVHGFVNRITKRATVLVEQPRGTLYDDGRKYSRYYVPLAKLSRLEAA